MTLGVAFGGCTWAFVICYAIVSFCVRGSGELRAACVVGLRPLRTAGPARFVGHGISRDFSDVRLAGSPPHHSYPDGSGLPARSFSVNSDVRSVRRNGRSPAMRAG